MEMKILFTLTIHLINLLFIFCVFHAISDLVLPLSELSASFKEPLTTPSHLNKSKDFECPRIAPHIDTTHLN